MTVSAASMLATVVLLLSYLLSYPITFGHGAQD